MVSRGLAAGAEWVTVRRAEQDALYRRYAPLIHRRCRGLLGNDEDARDATHDVYLRLLDRMHQFRGEADIATWIYRLTTNHCLHRLRRQRIWRRLAANLGLERSGDPRPQHEVRATLERLLDQLSTDDVALIVHVIHDGMEQREIAELLGVSERTIRARWAQIRQSAQELLARWEAQT